MDNSDEILYQMQQKQLSMLHELDRVCKKNGANPLVVTVLVDKKGLDDSDNVPIKSLIKINKVG